MSTPELDKLWDRLVNEAGVSDETLKIVTSINGYNLETLEDVLYVVTGLNSFEQLDKEAVK